MRFLRKLIRRRALHRDLAAELAFHREMAQSASNPIPLGNTLRIHESAADLWSFTLLESVWRDIVYSARALRRTPALVLIAIFASALGIGSTTAVFSLVNAILLKPIPVPHPDSFVELTPAATPENFAFWREHATALETVSAYMPGSANYDSGGNLDQLDSMQVSSDAFRCWGARFLLGRAFSPQDDMPRGPLVTVLDQAFWRTHFAAAPNILGKIISLNGDAYTVIGVAAASPFLLEQGPPPAVYLPMQLDPAAVDYTRRFRATARLKPGVTLAQANAQLQASSAAFRARFPRELSPRDSFAAVPYRDYLIGSDRRLPLLLLAAVGLVLLIACANVANLLSVRAEARSREIAIRAAIGAGRARLIRQLLIESLLLSLSGGALGSLLGFVGIRALLAISPVRLPRAGVDGSAIGIDWRVLLFALAVVLLTGSALLIRTFLRLYSVDPGFDSANVLTMRVKLTGDRFQNPAALASSIRDGLDRIRSLPGVESAAATYFIPLQTAIEASFQIPGSASSGLQAAGWVPVSPGYFDVLKIPVIRGRAFDRTDDASSTPVALINETMARQYWSGSDPLNAQIAVGAGSPLIPTEPVRRIAGIVGDVRHAQLYYDPRPTIYIPQAQIAPAMNAFLARIQPLAWMVRIPNQPLALAPAIRDQLRQATGLPVAEVRPLSAIVSSSTASQRFNMLLMSVFGGSALLLASIGIYGLISYSVQQRTREIGIRLALGAQARRLKIHVLWEGLRLALAGICIGIPAAFALTRFLASFLYGVPSHDPIAFLAVPIVLAAVALLAVWMPALRASRVNPVKALRYE